MFAFFTSFLFKFEKREKTEKFCFRVKFFQIFKQHLSFKFLKMFETIKQYFWDLLGKDDLATALSLIYFEFWSD